MRAWFAHPGAPTAPDGMPTFPGPTFSPGSVSNVSSSLRASGFSGTWTATSQGGKVWSSALCGLIGPLIASAVPGGDPLFPFTVTVNGGASGPNAYAWYLSQRVDPVRQPNVNYPLGLQLGDSPQLFTMVHPDNAHSGTVVIGVNGSEVAKLFGTNTPPTDAASLGIMFAGCALYCSRLSDQAYQWSTFV